MKNRLVFWQNIPSIHQAPLIREVARQWRDEVLVVTEKDISPDRLDQGWSRPDFSPAQLIVAPSEAIRRNLIEKTPENTVHIFSGFHAYPQTYRSFKNVARLKTGLGVFVEPGRNAGLSGVLRKWRYRLHAFRWGKRIDFLLATGEMGVRWYKDCGFSKEKIFPFAYFVEINAENSINERTLNDIYRLIFVGQLMEHKGFDLLLGALAKCQAQGWQLNVVGEGPERSKYEKMAKALGVESKIFWLGSLPNQEARKLMNESDCLILPSRYDGWGAVVNEALAVGTPVIVSDACGASDLVRHPELGVVFPTGNVDFLAEALTEKVRKGALTVGARVKIRNWAREKISACVGASYLLEIINTPFSKEQSIIAPWRKGGLE